MFPGIGSGPAATQGELTPSGRSSTCFPSRRRAMLMRLGRNLRALALGPLRLPCRLLMWETTQLPQLPKSKQQAKQCQISGFYGVCFGQPPVWPSSICSCLTKTRTRVAKSIFHDTQPESVHFSSYAFHCLLCAYLYAFHCLLSLYTLHSALALRTPLCISFPAHASMHFSVYFPCACPYALRSELALRMPLCISLSTLCMPLCSSLSIFPAHASTHFTLYLPYACLSAFHSVLALLCTFSTHASTHFTVYLPTLQPELRGRTLRTTFVLKSYDFAAGAAGTYFAYYFCT